MSAPPQLLSTRTLSKSDYILARGCDAKLHFRENQYHDDRGYDPYVRLLAEGGYMVEALARAAHPDGLLFESSGDIADDAARTLELLRRDAITIFQPAFLWRRRLVRVDILQKRGNAVRLLEVKAKSFNGEEHADCLRTTGRSAFRGKRSPYSILSDWQAKFEDVAFQTLIVERALPGVTVHPYLVLVDTTKRSTVDDLPSLFRLDRTMTRDGTARLHSATFVGTPQQLAGLDLLTEVDASAEVAMLHEAVDAEATRFESLLDAPFDERMAQPGAKCEKCEFRSDVSLHESGFAKCWGSLAEVTPHALDLFSIGTVKDALGTPVIETLFRDGTVSLFDIPDSSLVKKDGTVGAKAERQRRQIRQTRSGEQWIAPSLATKLQPLTHPLHFIDFEVSRLALPYHARMRPYGQVVFQWSCHSTDAAGGTPRHSEWLNDSETWPNLTFAKTLRDAIGDTDMVLVWSPFEASRLRELVKEHTVFAEYNQELVDWVAHLVGARMFDLHKCAHDDFYHPGMGGRTSIKVVLDALWKSDTAMRDQHAAWTGTHVAATEDPYAALPPLEIAGVVQDVHEGTGAMRAYEAMMYGVEKSDPDARAKWRQLLLQYCELDTLSMVLVYEYWRRVTGLS